LPANVILAAPAGSRQAAKKVVASRPGWDSAASRDAAFASLASPTTVRPLQRSATFRETSVRKLEASRISTTLVDKLLGSLVDD
jgi:hypothetical protein